ncbi:alpha/beta fold hydrolase [Prescottella equi]|jgi:2-hydroxy-6-oxonona-2,4-dienedioate hydrolase|uniref:alpha/beta fold hydrolase n=1 Tax=Rhodococcus hoagii TaxID=43767 RepID=UPI000A1186E2|nr:alpha/beta fold hydrolase [Prescottella equi]NKS75848.1 alpha/beta fold hydrolase [Prescottella equi]NKT14332.1 alpha/beta fold hydrolase [Prescottella equi]NKW47305.1 alpha/beta fold hydrolase [Prescottella equi]ORL03338.1 alpha/beta hydrolase [Prescottella equi]ORM08098.1 alpha/beta hydrolase [Prescottella equi]
MTIWNELAGLDFAVKTVDAAGIPTRSLQAGSGDEAVVFLHGTSGHLEAFARNIAVHAAHYECHAIDMLGHGYTGKPDYAYEIPRYVEHLVNYLDAVGLDKVHLVGESLGGWVAAHLASEQPERVLSLQLLAAGGTVANPEIMERIRTSTTKAVQSDDVELTRARLRLLMHDPVDATEELVEARHRIYHQPDFVANIHNLLSLQDMETRQRNLLRPGRLARIQAPTLVVWGHENPFGDVPEAKKMAEDIPGAQLQLYPECGHWPQHEQAALYNPLSLEFLAKASAHARSVA